jgi:DNA helicase IV
MAHEREVAEEQAFLDLALVALDHMRDEARSLRDSAAVANMRGAGDLVERDVVMGTALNRLDQLAIGDQPLFFGRIDYVPDDTGQVDKYHVGRLAVSDDELNPLVVDWRAPVAEAFYRATGVESLGLSRRRHVAMRGHEVISVEDEYFADANGELMLPEDEVRSATEEGLVEGGLALGGPGALLAALGRARTGRMGDIVATIQGEQDRIIRSPLAGVLLVQGGPGTGKTAVALHRAAYLLFTFRATLERQGVLVVGPNPLFLNYIENVLPSLGESGVTLSTISGLVTNVDIRGRESEDVDQLKGDVRMVALLGRALRTRQRPLRSDVRIPVGRAIVVMKARYTEEAVERARRRPGNHNQRRSAVGRELANRLAQEYYQRFVREGMDDVAGVNELADLIRARTEFNCPVKSSCTTSSARRRCCAPPARGTSATTNSSSSRESARRRSRRSSGPRPTRRSLTRRESSSGPNGARARRSSWASRESSTASTSTRTRAMSARRRYERRSASLHSKATSSTKRSS